MGMKQDLLLPAAVCTKHQIQARNDATYAAKAFADSLNAPDGELIRFTVLYRVTDAGISVESCKLYVEE